jgi:hypothetical protein
MPLTSGFCGYSEAPGAARTVDMDNARFAAAFAASVFHARAAPGSACVPGIDRV